MCERGTDVTREQARPELCEGLEHVSGEKRPANGIRECNERLHVSERGTNVTREPGSASVTSVSM